MSANRVVPDTPGFGADDTLWHNESVFKPTEERFGALLAEEPHESDRYFHLGNMSGLPGPPQRRA